MSLSSKPRGARPSTYRNYAMRPATHAKRPPRRKALSSCESTLYPTNRRHRGRQLQGLLDLFKEHFNPPAASIQLRHALRAPSQVVGQKGHQALLAVHPHPRHHPPHQLGVRPLHPAFFNPTDSSETIFAPSWIGYVSATSNCRFSLARVTQNSPRCSKSHR